MNRLGCLAIAFVGTLLAACGGGTSTPKTSSTPVLQDQYRGSIDVSGVDTDGNTMEAHGTAVALAKYDEGREIQVFATSKEDFGVRGLYRGLATFRVTNTYVGCDAASADLPMNIHLKLVGQQGNAGSNEVTSSYYWLGGTMDVPGVPVTTNCGGRATTVLVVAGFLTLCDVTLQPSEEKKLAQLSPGAPGTLSGNATVTCHNGLPETTWTMHWALS